VGAGPTLVGLHFPHKAPGNFFSGFCRERSRLVYFFPAVSLAFKQEAMVVFTGLYHSPEFGVKLFIQAVQITHFYYYIFRILMYHVKYTK
jgi:hypothetical protein